MSPRSSPASAAAAHSAVPTPAGLPARRTDAHSDTRPGARLDQLLDVLGGPALGWVRQQVLGRLEDDETAELTGVLQHLTATPAQRSAALELLGPAAVRGTRIAVRVEELEQLLAELAGWRAGLAAAVRALDGGSVELLEPDDELVGPDAVPDALLEAAVAVPPTAPAVVAGPPAPVDRPEPVATPVAGQIAEPAPVPVRRPSPAQELDDAAADAAGLELVDVVLALGLPVAPEPGPGASAAGLPGLVTLHQLRRSPPAWRRPPAGGTVFVCATPSVVAAVAAAGPPPAGREPVPVVCLDARAASGAVDPDWPGDAVVLLLDQLRAAGWRLRLNAGAGPEGAVLTELLAAELGALPWRSTDAGQAAQPAEAASDPLAVARPGVALLRQLVADVRSA